MEAVSDIKIILLGESDVGKTSLLLRFIENRFKDSLPKTAISYSEKVIKIEDKLLKVTLWDTAGREAYYKLVQSYYKVADGVLLVYDMQNSNTLSALSKWLSDFKSVNKNAEVLIAGNKTDDESKRTEYASGVKDFVQNEKLDCIEVSAKSGKNVDILFHHLVQKILAAKGILPYSKDSRLTALEKQESYIPWSSVSAETVSNTSNTINTPDVAESSGTCVKSTEQQHLNEMNYATNTRTNEGRDANELADDDDSTLGECGFICYPIEDFSELKISGEDSLTDSAESAITFFEAMGENVT